MKTLVNKMNTKEIHVYVFCGRERVGKSTACNYLSYEKPVRKQYHNPWLFIYSRIYNCDYSDLVQELGLDFTKTDIENLDSTKKHNFIKIINILLDTFNYLDLTWDFWIPEYSKNLNLSDIIKQISVPITGESYETLNGENGSRNVPCKKYPDLTLRKFLQLIGTEAFRNNFNENIWIDILVNRIIKNQEKEYYISDLRFYNEYIKLKKLFTLHGVLIYQNPSELELTPEVKFRHVSSWKYLEFAKNSDFTRIQNNSSLSDFYEKLTNLKSSRQSSTGFQRSLE